MAESLLDNDGATLDSNVPYLEQLVGEGKKFKTVEDLARGKAESDSFIKIMETRMDELRTDHLKLREDHQASAQLKDLIDNLSKTRNDDTVPDTNRDTVIQPAIKPEDIENLVAQQLTKHQLKLKQEENFNAMQAKLKEVLGNDYAPAYKQRLDTLGLSREFADDLAKNHPTVFVKTFGLDEVRQQSQQNLPRSSVRPNTFAPQTKKRDWNYYQEMKKSDPRMYLDPKIAVQMHDDAIALGADFGMPED